MLLRIEPGELLGFGGGTDRLENKLPGPSSWTYSRIFAGSLPWSTIMVNFMPFQRIPLRAWPFASDDTG